MKNCPKSSKNQWKSTKINKKLTSGGVPGPLGKGLGPILPPQASFGAPKRAQGLLQEGLGEHLGEIWDSFGEAKIHTFPIFFMLFCNLFSDKRLGRLPGRFVIDFGWFVGAFFDDFFENLSGLLHKRKCHSDTVFTMFEAHCHYRKCVKSTIFLLFFGDLLVDCFDLFSCLLYKWKCHSDTLFVMFEAHCHYGKFATNVIKSYTFQGCFSEGLWEWILTQLSIDFGFILDGLGAPQVIKQPSENKAKKSIEKSDAGNPRKIEILGGGSL